MLRDVVDPAVERLDRWLVGNGWAGYDPYDLRGLPFILHPASRKARAVRRLILKAENWFPLPIRRILGIETAVNAKGMGLFAEAYRQLYEATGDERHLKRGEEALSWLEAHCAPGYSGCCWGYPFDWQSRVLIPKGTPSSVVSATVGQAFWGFYRMTGERRYLDTCQSVCEFFVRDLKVSRFDNRRICFSYTPIDNFHVHNANLFAADLLIRVGLETSRSSYQDLGMQAAAYALSEQNKDGSLCYWGRDQSDSCRIDHYHSGFEIRSLYGIWKSTTDAEIYRAVQAYYGFYKERLFQRGTIPKMTPTSLYPVDIHSCAEAILCHSTLAPDFPEGRDFLSRCVPWTIEKMQHHDGWFIYMIRDIGGRARYPLEIPYIRWGQAWMLRALAACLGTAEDKTR